MDSEARIVDSMQAAARDVGLQEPDRERVRNVIGLGLLEAVQALMPRQAPQLHSEMVERYRQCYLGSNGMPSRLFPGAADVIRELAEQNYQLAVATGKSRRGLDQAMRDTGVDPYFHATRCADEAFSKPHPQMLEQIMDELGATPRETLMIGDTVYDMQLAANARTHALAVSYGVHGKERLMRHGPLDCLADVREISGWLSRSSGAEVEVA